MVDSRIFSMNDLLNEVSMSIVADHPNMKLLHLRKALASRPLPNSEERRLIALAQQGDSNALAKLIEHNTRFVVWRAYKMSRNNVTDNSTLHDCVAEGLIGLLEAIKKFDLAYSNRLITFADYTIRNRITRFVLMQRREIPIPAHQWVLWRRIQRLTSIEERDDIAIIMERTKLSERQLKMVFQPCLPLLSLSGVRKTTQDPIALELGYTDDVADRFVTRDVSSDCPHEILEHKQQVNQLNKFLRQLDILERMVLRRRFFDDDDLKEIGKDFGFSRERIRQLEQKALGKLRRWMSARE